MATTRAASSFLALPAELRIKIYEELLTIKTHTLYHDRKGRDDSFGIHPAILRVNRQIYTESARILYGHNVFLIELSTQVTTQYRGGYYPDGIPQPGLLFRVHSPTETQAQPTSHLGLIYPKSLQRLHHIGIVTAGDAIAGSSMRGLFFPHIGQLIVEILRCIIADADDDNDASLSGNEKNEKNEKKERGRKSLEVTIMRKSELERLQVGGRKLDELFELFRAVEKKRHVIWNR